MSGRGGESVTEEEKKLLTKEAEDALEQFHRRLDEEYERQKKFNAFMNTWGIWIMGFLVGIIMGWIYFS